MKPNLFSRRSLFSTGALGLTAALALRGHQGHAAVSSVLAGMQNAMCTTCGTQYPAADHPPAACPVCEDDRQYVGPNGQQWTTLEGLQKQGYKNTVRELEPGLWSITTEPKFAIGQRALLVKTPQGNVLWDCISLLDDETLQAVKKLGGITAIAISHPHYYSSMIEWSQAFGDVPIHLHEMEKEWVMRPDARVQFWSGETKDLGSGLTLVRTGGHFPGFQVLHWAAGAGGRGALLSGDQPQIAADRRWVSFMHSYPNYIPLNATAVRSIVAALEPLEYDRIYSAFTPGLVPQDAKGAVKRSAERYLKAIAG